MQQGSPASEASTCSAPSGSEEPRIAMLYVNIPFCRSKCAFCDYVQPIAPVDLMLEAHHPVRQRYIEALCTEIRARGTTLSAAGYVPRVLYWGGGTASNLEEPEIRAVMTVLGESFDLSGLVESTIECSPDTVDRVKLELFRSLGFNRLSCGIQSFDDERLRRLGRLHTAGGGRDAVRWAREAGFSNVNVDVMCGFLGETADELARTVQGAIETGAEHLSLYVFRPTPGTALRRRLDRRAGELVLDEQLASFRAGHTLLSRAGYSEYASGYFGRVSLFSQYYFQLRAALVGLGSGAMSIYQHRFRTHTKGRLGDYISDPVHYDVDIPADHDSVVMANLRSGLSCFDGILRDHWEQSIGISLDDALARPVFAPMLRYLRANGLVEDDRGARLPSDRAGQVLHELGYHLLRATRIEPAPEARRGARRPS